MAPMQDPGGSAPTGKQRKFLARPATPLGRWSVALAAAFAALFIINAAVFMRLPEAPWQPIVGPFYGIAMLLCGLAAGVTAALAVVRQGERSWLVFLPLLPALFVLFLVRASSWDRRIRRPRSRLRSLRPDVHLPGRGAPPRPSKHGESANPAGRLIQNA